MGDVSDWVSEGLAVSANAATASNVGCPPIIGARRGVNS